MNFEESERDPFEVFGEPEPLENVRAHEIDLDAVHNESEAHAAERRDVKAPFSWAAFMGGLAAILWIAGAIGGPLSFFGVDGVMAMDPAMQAGLIALAFGPAVLFWLGAAAAGEAVKARSFAAELTRLAQETRTPIQESEKQAQRLSMTVKGEIEALNDSVAAALNRLNELESIAQRNTQMFDGAMSATRENAQFMAHQLERERNAIVSLSGELRGQTEVIAHSIGRQVRLMREASKLVKTEISAAEDALETHLASFAASATMMGERTAAFHQAADSAQAATTQLHGTMAGMLDGLSEATRLTDAARKSSEQAVLAANETAAAVRETTRSAVFEAKRAAQAIRAETQALQEAAADTLSRLQGAANAARCASEDGQAAAESHAASIEKRLTALANAAGARRPAAPTTAPAPQVRIVERAPEPKAEHIRAEAEHGDLYSAASAAMARGGSRLQARSTEDAPESRRNSGIAGTFKGFGSWGNFTPAREEEKFTPANEAGRDAFALVDFGSAKKDPDIVLKADALDIVLASGVDLDNALAPADLDMIARNSRNGAAARRQAVTDAAPNAVSRVSRHIKRHAEARSIASAFRARPDLAKSESKSEGADLVRAYLLIDAALA
ncbi:methyltransferase type 11 [alpha proteobacterium U9-1i]|nr:methyltransferase type 11 [alpha proteobacterium U9-1i]